MTHCEPQTETINGVELPKGRQILLRPTDTHWLMLIETRNKYGLDSWQNTLRHLLSELYALKQEQREQKAA